MAVTGLWDSPPFGLGFRLSSAVVGDRNWLGKGVLPGSSSLGAQASRLLLRIGCLRRPGGGREVRSPLDALRGTGQS